MKPNAFRQTDLPSDDNLYFPSHHGATGTSYKRQVLDEINSTHVIHENLEGLDLLHPDVMPYINCNPARTLDGAPISRKLSASKSIVSTPHIMSAVEVMLITFGYFVIVWFIAPNLESNGLILFMKLLLVSFFFYISYLSPALIHKDSLSVRGMGDWRTLFFRVDNIVGAYKYYLGLTFASAAVILCVALMHNSEHFSGFSWHALWLKFGLNLLNALGQDMLFLSFFMPRLKEMCSYAQASSEFGRFCSKYKIIVISMACALLCALYHAPNLPLMLLVFILGFAVAWIYYLVPNLALAAVSHAIIGTLLHRVLEMHMRIGPFYWESDKYVYRTLFPGLRELIGNAF